MKSHELVIKTPIITGIIQPWSGMSDIDFIILIELALKVK